MYDTWLKAVDDGELSGVCLLDMSAAFDIVDHTLLLQKLELYGFDGNAVGWVNSYLSDRKQCVSIDGSMSSMLHAPNRCASGEYPWANLLYTFHQ